MKEVFFGMAAVICFGFLLASIVNVIVASLDEKAWRERQREVEANRRIWDARYKDITEAKRD